jgi:hypothetical protein
LDASTKKAETRRTGGGARAQLLALLASAPAGGHISAAAARMVRMLERAPRTGATEKPSQLVVVPAPDKKKTKTKNPGRKKSGALHFFYFRKYYIDSCIENS